MYMIQSRFFLVVLSLIIVLILGCTKKETDNLNILKVAISSNPTNLDSRFSTDMASRYVTHQIYRSLFFINDRLEVDKDLAISYSMPDTLTLIVSLVEDAFFSNGDNLTAYDIKFTYESIIDTESLSPYKKSFDFLDRIVIVDKYKIKFVLSRSFAPFLTNLTVGILPKKLSGKTKQEFSRNPIGAGPFQIDEWISDEKVILSRNRYYKGSEITIKKIIFKILPDDNTRYLELFKGSVDLAVNNIPQDMVKNLKAKKNINIFTAPGLNYSYLGFNCQNKILKNKLVRQAIAYAINRDAMIKHILNGYALKAANLLVSDHWAFEKSVICYEYNLQMSKKLLDSAGYPENKDGIRFSIEYKALNKDSTRRIAEVVQAQLKKIGIDVKLKMYEWGTFYGDIKKGNFEMFQMTWVGITEPDIYYYIFHSNSIPPHGANRGRYINHKIDDLVEKGRYELNVEKRKKIYSEVQKIISEESPYVSLWYNANIIALNVRVKYYKPHPSANLKYLSLTRIIR